MYNSIQLIYFVTYLVAVLEAAILVSTQAARPNSATLPSSASSPPSVHDDGVSLGEEDVVLRGVEGHAALEGCLRSPVALRNTELVLLKHRSEEEERLDSGQRLAQAVPTPWWKRRQGSE